jgi:hypothetical protein
MTPLETIAAFEIPTTSFVAAVRYMKDNMMNLTKEVYEDMYNQITTHGGTSTSFIGKDDIESRYSFLYLVQNIIQAEKKGEYSIDDVITKAHVDTSKFLTEYDFSFNNEQRVTTTTEIVDGVEVLVHTPKKQKGALKNKDIVAGIINDAANISKTKEELIELIMKKIPDISKSNANVYVYNYNKAIKS